MHYNIICMILGRIMCDMSVRPNLEPKMFQNLVPKMTPRFQIRAQKMLCSGMCKFERVRTKGQHIM